MNNLQQENPPVKISVRTTLEIKDVITGRKEKKVWVDGELKNHEIISEGIKITKEVN